MKISIGIATKITSKKREKFLYAALESVLNQTSSSWELIISDDNSSILPNYSRYEDNPKIRIFYQEKTLGVFKNFNFCLHKAQGDFFVLLGDDDLLDPNFIKNLSLYSIRNPTLDLIVPNHHLIDHKGNIILTTDLKETKHLSGKETLNSYFDQFSQGVRMPLFFCGIINTKKLKSLGGYPDFGLATDLYLIYFFLYYFNFGVVEDVLFSIRKHSLNLSGIRKIDTIRQDTINTMDIVRRDFFYLLTEKNKKKFLEIKKDLYYDHTSLLLDFMKYGRIFGISSFFQKKMNFRTIIILLFGLFFGKKIHPPIIYLDDIYSNLKTLLFNH